MPTTHHSGQSRTVSHTQHPAPSAETGVTPMTPPNYSHPGFPRPVHIHALHPIIIVPNIYTQWRRQNLVRGEGSTNRGAETETPINGSVVSTPSGVRSRAAAENKKN